MSKYDSLKCNNSVAPLAGDLSNSKYHSPLDSIKDLPEDEADCEYGEGDDRYRSSPDDHDDAKVSNSSTSPPTISTNKSKYSLTSDSDSLFAKRLPPPSSKNRKAKKKGHEGREAFVFVEEEVKKAEKRNKRSKRSRKGRRRRSSVDDESLALQSLEDVNLNQ